MEDQRVIHRGADSIRFLGNEYATFALPFGHSKKSMPKGWNLPGAGVGVDEAIAHFERGNNNVDVLAEFVTILDIDFNFPDKVAVLGNLADTAKVWRTNAPDRGALLYKVVDGPVTSVTWTPEGATEPHAELLAQTKTGNFKKKSVVGFHKGGEYAIVDAQHGIREITRADLNLIWLLITGEEMGTPKPVKLATSKPVERKAVNSHDAFVAQVEAAWSSLRVFEHHGFTNSGTQSEPGGATRILKRGGLIIQKDGSWYCHNDEIGSAGCIGAWAYCTKRSIPDGAVFWEVIEEMADAAGIEVPRRNRAPEPEPLPEGARVLDNGHVILKTTPTPEPKPRRKTPAMTPSVVERLAQELRGPIATKLLEGIARNREIYRDVLIQLVTVIAPEKGGWVFDADQRWLGEKLGKSGMSAGRNMWALDKAGKIRYLHTGKTDDANPKAGRPLMRVDLQPLIADLWESCVNVTNKENPRDMFVTFRNDSESNVFATYSGAGKFADASMRTLYKYAVARMGQPTVLARSLTASALTVLDYLTRAEEATRAEMVAATGISPGSAAGGTRVLEQLGLVSVEWDGPGTAKVYVLRLDWEQHLQYMIRHMASYGARIRLVIRTYDERIEYLDWQLKQRMSPAEADDLREHKQKLEQARKKWCVYGNKIGAYGRYAQATPPW